MTDDLSNSSARGNGFHRDDTSLVEVVGHYDSFFKVGLTDDEKSDLIEALLAPVDPGSRESQGDGSPINPGGGS